MSDKPLFCLSCGKVIDLEKDDIYLVPTNSENPKNGRLLLYCSKNCAEPLVKLI